MSATTSIEWTQRTWNPVVGCERVSPGCDHCYAIGQSNRLQGTAAYAGTVSGGDWTGVVRCLPGRLGDPYHWAKPSLVFVNSMADLFHDDVRYEFIREVFNTMRSCNGMRVAATGRCNPSHTFQVLTKRAERMERLIAGTPRALGFDPARPPANVWLGVSVESPTYYSRIRHLQRTPVALRFLSCEPLLAALPNLPLDGIGWVIAGGESGPGARPMHPDWARGIRDQCAAAGVPFFFKQWGAWAPADVAMARRIYDDVVMGERGLTLWPDGRSVEGTRRGTCTDQSADMWRVGKTVAGRELDGLLYDEMPARAEVAA